MWIPNSVYERAPQFWLVLGLLFMSSGLYLGFGYSWSYFYFGVGFACCLFSMWVFTMRLKHRQQRPHTAHRQAGSDIDDDVSDRGIGPAADYDTRG
jgi:hypothetical protein